MRSTATAREICSTDPAHASDLRTVSLQVANEPINSERGNLLERSWFFEQMGGTRDDIETLLANQLGQRLTVELQHNAIVAAESRGKVAAVVSRGGRPD